MAKGKRAKRETVRGLSVDPEAFDLSWLTGSDPAEEEAAGEAEKEREPKTE